MLDKFVKLKEYRAKMNNSLDSILISMKESTRNIILINSNSPFANNLFFSKLIQNNLRFYLPSYSELESSYSLGNFLRTIPSRISNDQYEVLVFDWYEELKQIDKQYRLIDEININRDLFTKHFNSVVMIASPILAYRIMNEAYDFWSCVDYYFDTTKWFCTPINLPIISLKPIFNTTNELIVSFNKNSYLFNQYIGLKKNIENVKTYSDGLFWNLLSKINEFHEIAYYYELLYSLTKKMISVPAKGEKYNTRIQDLKKISLLINNIFLTCDIRIVLANFFYNCGEYSFAQSIYKSVLKSLEESWMDSDKEAILAFLKCNIFVCKYLQSNEQSSIKLINDVERILVSIDLKLIEKYRNFIQDYIFLLGATYCHHSFLQHKDIFKRLNTTQPITYRNADISETYNNLLFWESFIDKNFCPVSSLYSNSIILKIYQEIQKSIYYFCLGDYHHSQKHMKSAKYYSKSYGYLDIHELLFTMKKNMFFLYKESSFNLRIDEDI